MKYTVKAVKFSPGHDSCCMNCNLYHGKKKIASVWDDSYGGGYQYTWVSDEEEKEFLNHVKSQPQWESEFTKGKKFNMTNDIYIHRLIKQVEKEKEEKKRIKLYEKAIVVMTKDDDSDYSYFRMPKGKTVAMIPKEVLRNWVSDIERDLKPDEYIANTNI